MTETPAEFVARVRQMRLQEQHVRVEDAQPLSPEVAG